MKANKDRERERERERESKGSMPSARLDDVFKKVSEMLNVSKYERLAFCVF